MGDNLAHKKKFSIARRNKSMDYKGAVRETQTQHNAGVTQHSVAKQHNNTIMPDSINLKKLVETGNFEGLKSLLEKEKTAIHSTDAEQQTLLHFACEYGQPEIAKYLLEKGLDVNAKNKFGWTPVILAVCHGHLAVAMELCQQDDIDMSPKIPNSSRNVLHFLGRHWSPDIVPIILRKCGPDVINARDHHGDSPLHRACIHCNIDCIKALILCHADVNLQNNHGETPLHYASRAGVEEVVNFLLANGADESIKGKYGTYLEVNNTSASTPLNREESQSISPPTLAYSNSAPLSNYAALVSPPSASPPPPSFLITPSPLTQSTIPETQAHSPRDVQESETSITNTTIVAESSDSDGVTVVTASAVVTNEEGNSQTKQINATTISATSTSTNPSHSHSHPQSSMSQAIGAVGTAVGAVLGSAVGSGTQGGKFSVGGTVKKLVEGILASDVEIPGFDTKKLFQKMVYLTNFKDILTREIVPQLKTKLLTSTLPHIAGSADTPIGEIQYEVWKLSLSSLSFDDKSISCEPKLEGLKISMKLSAMLKNIHFRYSTHVMKDEGTASAEVQNISCVFILGVDIENKRPKLTIKETLVEMENLNLEIHKAKAKWLYNTIFGVISNKVKNQIGQLLTTALSQQLAVLEGLFNDKLVLLWNKMKKKKKKKAKQNPDTALITAQTAANLVVNEEILRIKAEIARTKLEVLKMSLPPPKGDDIKCYYYKTQSTSPIIIMVDMHEMETVAALQKYIIHEYQYLDPKTFPARCSLSNVKAGLKQMLINNNNTNSNNNNTESLPGKITISSSSTPTPSVSPRADAIITNPNPELLFTESISPNSEEEPNTEQLIVLPNSDKLVRVQSYDSKPSTTITLPISLPTKIDINALANFANRDKEKEKSGKKSVDWKFKDKDGDFVSITKHNTMDHIRKHALSLHIFEKRDHPE